MRNKLILPLLTLFLITLIQCSLSSNEPTRPNIPGKLVFSKNKDGVLSIFTMNANGSKLRELSNGSNPSWYDEGNAIIFERPGSTTLGPNIVTMSQNGKNVSTIRLQEDYELIGNEAKMNNDETQVLFQWCTTCGAGGLSSDVYVYHLSSDTLIKVSETVPGFTSHKPEWVVNDESIVFAKENIRPGETEIMIYEFDTQESLQIAFIEGRIIKLSPSPDAKYLVSTVAVETNREVQLFDLEKKVNVSLNLNLYRSEIVNWSKDGTHLTLIGSRAIGRLPFLYYYAFNQGTLTLLDSLRNEYIINGEGFDWYAE